MQVRQQPGGGFPRQGRRDRAQLPVQGGSASLIAGGQPGHLLHERGLWTGGVLAVQAAHRQIDQDRAAADRLVGHVPHVPAVHPRRGPSARRARDRHTLPGPRRDPDHARTGLHRIHSHRGQLRQ